MYIHIILCLYVSMNITVYIYNPFVTCRYEEWAHPYFISYQEYERICDRTNALEKIKGENWVKETITAWRSVSLSLSFHLSLPAPPRPTRNWSHQTASSSRLDFEPSPVALQNRVFLLQRNSAPLGLSSRTMRRVQGRS